jgi:hypothetical protein
LKEFMGGLGCGGEDGRKKEMTAVRSNEMEDVGNAESRRAGTKKAGRLGRSALLWFSSCYSASVLF